MGVSFTDGREKFLLFNTAAILPAFLLQIPVLKIAQAIGPFRNPINRLTSRIFLPRVSKIITRGSGTHRFGEQLGLQNLLEGADSAFLLRHRRINEPENEGPQGGPIKIGIIPSEVVRKKFDKLKTGGYVDLLTQVVVKLQERGNEVRLIAHSARQSHSRQNNDLHLCREILREVGSTTQITFIDQEQTVEQLRKEIQDCDIVFTGRFHGMVTALSVGVVPVVMGWGHKYDEVLSPFGLADNAFPYDQATPDLIVNMLDVCVDNSKKLEEQIARSLPGVVEKAQIQNDAIGRYLLNTVKT
jgi:polysaccharide pyruvyl transferase WcaK-like protein